jgi:phage terminase small subunit
MTRKRKLTEQTELTPIQKRFALQVATLNNVSAASRLVGVSDRTGRRWMDVPLVQEYVHELQDQAFDTAMHMLEISTLSAVSMLNEAMNSEHTENNLKVKAAQILLDRGIEAHKVKLLDERMAQLERRLSMIAIVKEGEIVP